MKRKCLAIGIILLFIGVAIAPSINVTVVKASNDNYLVEVTTQACGIKGFGNTTVKLTRQQAIEIDQLFESINSKMNNATSREDSVRIYHDAIIELNNYGLLPQGMTIEHAQRLVIGGNQNHNQRLLNRQQEIFPAFVNIFCLLFGSATEEPNPHPGVPVILLPIGPLSVIGLPLVILLSLLGAEILVDVLVGLVGIMTLVNPFKFMNFVIIFGYDTDFYSLGLKGSVNCKYVGLLLGYTGLLFFTFGDKVYFLGSALAVV
jgi:hypothetical protein